MKKTIRRRAGLLCLAWLLLSVLPAAAAQDSCGLTVRYPCPGVTFQLYQVGREAQAGGYALTGDFTAYPVSLSGLDAQGWAGAAELLDAYAAREGLTPLQSAVTDEDGTLTFSHLTPGLYLIGWSRHTTGGAVYTPQPFLTALPGLDEAGEAIDAVTATPKYGKTATRPGTVDCLVRLRWTGESYDAYRSREVVAQLLCDGGADRVAALSVANRHRSAGRKDRRAALTAAGGLSGEPDEQSAWRVYEEVELNEANGWSYDWEGLDGRYTWRVLLKDVPEGYSLTMERDGSTFNLTLATAEEPPQSTPSPGVPPASGGSRDDPDDADDPPASRDRRDDPDSPSASTVPGASPGPSVSPKPDSASAPDTSGEESGSPGPGAAAGPDATPADPADTPAPGGPEGAEDPDEPRIPQTGQLWWPVPLLALAGLALYLLGWWRSRRDDHES